MAKHGILTNVEGTEDFTFVSKTGLESVTTGLTTIFKPSEAVVGTPKLIALGLAAVAGNAVATHSATGKIGISALGRELTMG